ncbi:TPA: hypothetical protein ACX6RX_003175 [Photobacterium damselae]
MSEKTPSCLLAKVEQRCKEDGYKPPLQVQAVNGHLVIAMDLEAVYGGLVCNPTGEFFAPDSFESEIHCDGIIITDFDKLFPYIMSELRSEDESGTTMIHRMIDKATLEAVSNGAEGVLTASEFEQTGALDD